MTVLAPPLSIDPFIAEAKQRARRRRSLALAAAALIVAGLLVFELAPAGSSTAGGAHGANNTIPWLPTKPDLGPSHPPLAPPCTASQLSASLFLGGVTQSLIGPISVVNRSSRRCSLLGRPTLSFAGATSKWREATWSSPAGFDPLAPRRSTLRALAPGEHVRTDIQCWNWCGAGAKGGGSSSKPPSALVLSAPGGGRLPLTPTGTDSSEPVCNGGPGSVSMLYASRFTPVAYEKRMPWLPLKAAFASGPSTPVRHGLGFSGPWFRARSGSRLDFTIVLTNTSRKAFRFGRHCPPYVEDFGGHYKFASVLICHGVGPIGPRQSVRFAMRVHIPRGDAGSSFFWELAPDTFRSPSDPMAWIISPTWSPKPKVRRGG
jgi:hypothetical protein